MESTKKMYQQLNENTIDILVHNSILCNKFYKRHFRHEFYVRHEQSVAELLFTKQVSKEVYKTCWILYFFYDQINK
jgi:hypothetical protein